MSEPELTPSILATIPEALKELLVNTAMNKLGRQSVLISSNNLANRFIFTRWEIRPSQRRRYKALFSSIRMHCRILFNHYLLRGRIEWIDASGKPLFGVYKFDEVRGNIILGFVKMTPESEWTLSNR